MADKIQENLVKVVTRFYINNLHNEDYDDDIKDLLREPNFLLLPPQEVRRIVSKFGRLEYEAFKEFTGVIIRTMCSNYQASAYFNKFHPETHRANLRNYNPNRDTDLMPSAASIQTTASNDFIRGTFFTATTSFDFPDVPTRTWDQSNEAEWPRESSKQQNEKVLLELKQHHADLDSNLSLHPAILQEFNDIFDEQRVRIQTSIAEKQPKSITVELPKRKEQKCLYSKRKINRLIEKLERITLPSSHYRFFPLKNLDLNAAIDLINNLMYVYTNVSDNPVPHDYTPDLPEVPPVTSISSVGPIRADHSQNRHSFESPKGSRDLLSPVEQIKFHSDFKVQAEISSALNAIKESTIRPSSAVKELSLLSVPNLVGEKEIERIPQTGWGEGLSTIHEVSDLQATTVEGSQTEQVAVQDISQQRIEVIPLQEDSLVVGSAISHVERQPELTGVHMEYQINTVEDLTESQQKLQSPQERSTTEEASIRNWAEILRKIDRPLTVRDFIVPSSRRRKRHRHLPTQSCPLLEIVLEAGNNLREVRKAILDERQPIKSTAVTEALDLSSDQIEKNLCTFPIAPLDNDENRKASENRRKVEAVISDIIGVHHKTQRDFFTKFIGWKEAVAQLGSPIQFLNINQILNSYENMQIGRELFAMIETLLIHGEVHVEEILHGCDRNTGIKRFKLIIELQAAGVLEIEATNGKIKKLKIR